jgi:hypothetical protein
MTCFYVMSEIVFARKGASAFFAFQQLMPNKMLRFGMAIEISA